MLSFASKTLRAASRGQLVQRRAQKVALLCSQAKGGQPLTWADFDKKPNETAEFVKQQAVSGNSFFKNNSRLSELKETSGSHEKDRREISYKIFKGRTDQDFNAVLTIFTQCRLVNEVVYFPEYAELVH